MVRCSGVAVSEGAAGGEEEVFEGEDVPCGIRRRKTTSGGSGGDGSAC